MRGVEADGTVTGFTCCQAGDLLNPDSTADNRIDHIWHLGRFRTNQAEVRGSDPVTGRTPSGLWASDHFGRFSARRASPLSFG